MVVTTPTIRELPGTATALVLSPTPQKLVRLRVEWQEVVEAAGLRPERDATEEPPVVAPGLLGGTLADFADERSPIDTAAANGSSISFVFEYGGKRVLFGADAHPDVLTSGFAQLAEKPYRLDACKLPHHGSKGNVTVGLVEALDCPLWLVSSNGVRFRHPDDAALARVVLRGARGDRQPSIAWNYRSERCKAFTSSFPPARSRYQSLEPDTEGLVLNL